MSALRTGLLAFLGVSVLAGCPKEKPRTFAEPPAPLATRPFSLPPVTVGELSNGIKVVVAEEHEVPLVYVRLALHSGGWTDPLDRPGLASATVDMLNEGAAGMSADQLSRELRKLASDLGTGASLDGAVVSLKALRQNLAPSLDLMAAVVLQPEFPEAEWEILRGQRIQDLKALPQDPRRISGNVWRKLMYGDQYAGNVETVAAYEAMTVAEMQDWYAQNVDPANTTLLVGGDTTLAEVLPLLEARFGQDAFPATDIELPTFSAAGVVPRAQPGTVYLVDKPGAAQSVVRVSLPVGAQTDADADALQMANMAVGGQFSARINMNLREDKGWTYGASSWISYNYMPGIWSAYTSVVTPHTAEAVAEILAEVQGALGPEPITEAELASGKGDILGSWPLRFEKPGYLLDQALEVERYHLPEDWLQSYPDRIRGVSLDAAQQAWTQHIQPEARVVLGVGDAATVREGLAALGRPLVMLDVNGSPVEGASSGN